MKWGDRGMEAGKEGRRIERRIEKIGQIDRELI